MLLIIISLTLAYLLGSIPSGLIIGKTFYKIDIREHGSKNLGATNSFRILGSNPELLLHFNGYSKRYVSDTSSRNY